MKCAKKVLWNNYVVLQNIAIWEYPKMFYKNGRETGEAC